MNTSTPELIVEFRTGITEDEARRVVERAGATVRRRMRSDDPALIRLLAQLSDPAAGPRIAAAAEVARTEDNGPAYGVR